LSPRLFIIPSQAHVALFVSTLLIAWWRGGWRERLIATIAAAQYFAAVTFPAGWGSANHIVRGSRSLIGDLLMLAACVVCVRGARRYWVIWAATFALLSVVTDIAFLLSPTITSFAFISADDIWAWAQAWVVIWAALTNPDRGRATA
jgi:hypothetical protein